MTLIICQLTDCIHNRSVRCKCTAIGMQKAGCDSYMETPEVFKNHVKEQGAEVDGK